MPAGSRNGSQRSADGSTDNPFSGAATIVISDATGSGGAAQFGTTYSFSLTITRVDDSQVSVTAMITDGASLLIEWPVTTTSASPASFTYDSVGILVGGTTDAGTATFTDIEVSTGEPEQLVVRKIEYDEDGGMIAITFTSEPGKQYTVETSADLLAWTGDVGDTVEAAADAETTRYEFPDTGLETRYFFRVLENPPPDQLR